jgi:nucleoside-diphosphate-sugar epimerase
MYGLNPKGPVTEDAPLNPISYAIEYQKAERPFLKKHNHAPLMICRPGWIFGPDSWYKEFFTDIIQNEGYVPQYGNGENFMSIIHRDDLARLVKEYVLNAPYSNVYNLFSPVGLPHKEFVMKLSQMYKKDIKVISEDELIQKYGEVVCHALTCDIHMATKYPAIMDKFNFEFRSVEDLLAKT